MQVCAPEPRSMPPNRSPPARFPSRHLTAGACQGARWQCCRADVAVTRCVPFAGKVARPCRRRICRRSAGCGTQWRRAACASARSRTRPPRVMPQPRCCRAAGAGCRCRACERRPSCRGLRRTAATSWRCSPRCRSWQRSLTPQLCACPQQVLTSHTSVWPSVRGLVLARLV